MAQMTRSLAEAILKGDGITRNEIEQLCRHFLATLSKDKATLHGECATELTRLRQQLSELKGDFDALYKERDWYHEELEKVQGQLAEVERKTMTVVRQATQAVQDWHERNDITVEEALDMVDARALTLGWTIKKHGILVDMGFDGPIPAYVHWDTNIDIVKRLHRLLDQPQPAQEDEE